MNIAQSKKRIEELIKQKEELYILKIIPIDKEIETLQLNIINKCTHPNEYLLDNIVGYDDEYGCTVHAWQEHNIKCITCGKELYIKSSYINKCNPDLSSLFLIPEDKLKELR